ncbi:MAG: hypothetical protein R3A52_26810 [Polyangiales bacterium]
MGFPSPAVEDALRRRHPTLRWVVYETSTPWTFVHSPAVIADVFVEVVSARRVEPAGALVACFCGWGFGPIGFGVTTSSKPPRLPSGAVEIAARVIDVTGGELRLGPAPIDGFDEGVTLPCPHTRVKVTVAHVPFDAEAPESGWLYVMAHPETSDDARSGEVVNCEV